MSKESLEKARKSIQENGVTFLNPQEKFERKPTRASAIHAMCYQCYGSGHDKSWKWSIGNCPSEGSCSLWQFRPFQNQVGKVQPGSVV